MTARKRPTSDERASKQPRLAGADEVNDVVAALKRLATKKTRNGMARFAIPSDKAFGVAVGDIRKYAKQLGPNHELAEALWASGWYEARLLACFVDEPENVTPAQMDRWCRDFDSWAVCDTACFHLFDRTPHAFRKVAAWAKRKPEFERRAAFALLASLGLHDKQAADELFMECLPLVENAATDERNFVKKGVVWAFRGVGGRNAALHAVVLSICQRLADSADVTSRWVGKTTLRELKSPAATRRLAAQRGKAKR